MRAINSNVMKQINRRLVLDCIRRRPISRAELSDETQLTRASITQIVEALMADGYVAESAAVDSRGPGRRQTKLALLEDSLHIAGIILSCTEYHISIVNLAGHTLWSGSGTLLNRNPQEVLQEIAQRLRMAAAELNRKDASRRIFGAGLCVPSPMDCAAGKLPNSPCMEAWRGVPAARMLGMLEENLGWKVHPANIANAHTLDEKYFGIGRDGVENFMLLRADETVGAGVIQNGRLLSGPQGQCMEIGHVSFDRSGPACACGSNGCLEQYLSFPAALKGSPFESWEQVVHSMDSDALAAELFERVAKDLAFAVSNILNIFCLEKIVLSGQLVHGGARLAEAVNFRLATHKRFNATPDPVVGGSEIQLSRIAAIPAYHRFFS